MSAHIQPKRLRQIFEASAFSLLSTINTRPGIINLSPSKDKSVLNSYSISNFY